MFTIQYRTVFGDDWVFWKTNIYGSKPAMEFIVEELNKNIQETKCQYKVVDYSF